MTNEQVTRAFIRTVRTIVNDQPGVTRVSLLARLPPFDVESQSRMLDDMVANSLVKEVKFQVAPSSPVNRMYFPQTYVLHYPPTHHDHSPQVPTSSVSGVC